MERVFHIISHIDIGGAERVAINIAKSKNPKFEYHLIEVVRSDSDFTIQLVEELERANIYVHRSPYKNNKLGILFFWLWFTKIYMKYEPSVIHVHTEMPDFSIWIFRKLAWTFWWIKPKYVRTIHSTQLWNSWKPLGCIIESFYIKYHCNVAISSSTRDCYEKAYKVSDLPIIYNGLGEVVQKPFNGIVESKKNVLFAGRLCEEKGIDILLAVLKKMANADKYHFHIIGAGPYMDDIKANVAGNNNISVYDKIYGLSQYLQSFDYLFMPSRFEGLPLIAIEASLARTPTIINRCPGLKDTLPKDWPLAVDDNSVDAFVDIFCNKLDTLDYEKLANVAYLYVKKNFSISKMQREYEKVYESKI